METREKVFVAFNRKLLRSLEHIREEIMEGNIEKALFFLDEIIEDTETDIGIIKFDEGFYKAKVTKCVSGTGYKFIPIESERDKELRGQIDVTETNSLK